MGHYQRPLVLIAEINTCPVLNHTSGVGLGLVRSLISLTAVPRLRLGPARARPDRAARRLARDTGFSVERMRVLPGQSAPARSRSRFRMIKRICCQVRPAAVWARPARPGADWARGRRIPLALAGVQ